MKLTAPTKPVFIIALVIGLLGIIANWVAIPVATGNQFYFVSAAFVRRRLDNLDLIAVLKTRE